VREKLLAHNLGRLPYTRPLPSIGGKTTRRKPHQDLATIVVERETQKPIIIGKRGDMINGSDERGSNWRPFLGARSPRLHVAVPAPGVKTSALSR